MRSRPASVLVVLGALVVVVIHASVALAAPATPGPYAGTTDQLCPPFAVAKELCEERERLPISLEATSTRIDSIKATVVEHCEDGLPPRLVEIELPHSYRLKREGSDRASFNIKLGAHPLPGNEAEGFVRRQEARGELAALQKDPDDPTGEAYCYAEISWQVFPGRGSGTALTALPEGGASEAPGAVSSPPPVQRCRTAALARPRVVRALKMTHPGIWPNTGHPLRTGGRRAVRIRSRPGFLRREICANRARRSRTASGRPLDADLLQCHRLGWSRRRQSNGTDRRRPPRCARARTRIQRLRRRTLPQGADHDPHQPDPTRIEQDRRSSPVALPGLGAR